jgi:hypothetical protein
MSDINTLNTVSSPDPISNENVIINEVQMNSDAVLKSKDVTLENDVKIILNEVDEKNSNSKESLFEISKVVSLDPTEIINSSIPMLSVIKISSIDLDKYLSFITDENIKQLVTILTNNEGPIKDISNIVDLIMADGKIDINDVPLLISFLKKLISLKTADFKELKNLAMSDYIKAIKLVLIILAKENVLKLPNSNQFITDISKILDDLSMVEQVGAKMCSCLSFIR